MGAQDYQHPYPSAALASEYPFVPLKYERPDLDEVRRRADAHYTEMAGRRSVRMFSPDPLPREIIDRAIATASTAPSGAHHQPWTFVATDAPEVKAAIREAAEVEERENYEGGRMNDEWQGALAPLGTDWHKEFLEVAPWLVVVFEQRYGLSPAGERRHHYYVKESVGLACGLFIAAIHRMGLVTLPHTPTPMAFLRRILQRPENERPFILFPVGFPYPGVRVPDLARKPLAEVAVHVDELAP